MTVSSSTSKSRYTGNGVTTAFTGSFRILDEDHVTVTHTSTVGVDTVKTITTDYTVSGVGGSSFTVTHLVAPASGVVVTLSRNVPATQELDLVENDAMPANDLETAFDKATMLFQQAKEAADRSVRFPVSDSTSRTAELPSASLRAGKVLAFDADGDVIVSTEDLTDIEGSITASAASAAAAAASAVTAAASATAAQTAETNAETAEVAAEAAQAAAEAAAASIGLPLDANETTFAATKRVLGRNTAGAGLGEEVTLSQLLDWIGSAAWGDILFRGTAGWERLAAGTSGQYLKTLGASANPAWDTVAAGPTLATPVSPSGSAQAEWTGIPTGTKRIEINFDGLSFGSGADINVVIGDSGGYETSGYDSLSCQETAATTTSTTNFIGLVGTAAPTMMGRFVLELLDAATFTWVCTHFLRRSDTTNITYGVGTKSLSAELDRVKLAASTGNFDAGKVNILYS